MLEAILLVLAYTVTKFSFALKFKYGKRKPAFKTLGYPEEYRLPHWKRDMDINFHEV